MSTIGNIAAPGSTLAASGIGMQDFLDILLTQLTYQDPLKPVDNQAFIAQMAQFTTLGQTQELNEKIGSLLSTQASMQAIGLIGRTVQFANDQGAATTGTVASLSWAGSTPMLGINVTGGGTVSDISLSRVTLIK